MVQLQADAHPHGAAGHLMFGECTLFLHAKLRFVTVRHKQGKLRLHASSESHHAMSCKPDARSFPTSTHLPTRPLFPCLPNSKVQDRSAHLLHPTTPPYPTATHPLSVLGLHGALKTLAASGSIAQARKRGHIMSFKSPLFSHNRSVPRPLAAQQGLFVCLLVCT